MRDFTTYCDGCGLPVEVPLRLSFHRTPPGETSHVLTADFHGDSCFRLWLEAGGVEGRLVRSTGVVA